MFKFAVDNHKLYGSDELVMKAAAHELVGLMSLIECNVPGLHFPLFTLIDYHGYRMIATSMLPIDKTTLVYGSADAGNTVLSGTPSILNKFENIAQKLNLVR